MKVAILTFSHAVNRGAHMQCYALSRFIRERGHEVQVIHIELPRRRTSFKGWIDYSILHFRNRFFRKKYYPAQTRTYRNAEMLLADPPDADIFVAGSDQIWNTDLTAAFGYKSFFLDFCPEGTRRIAYAASFGSSDLHMTKEMREEVRRLLHRFEAISVRETDAEKICRDWFGIENAITVVDPVFLHNDYAHLLGNRKSSSTANYIYNYRLCRNDASEQIMGEIHRSMPPMPVILSDDWTQKWRFLPIESWLRRIHDARFVVTNSFHCMAFCILFHKDFVVTPPFPGRENRMISMLEQLGIAERYVASSDDFQRREQTLLKPIYYQDVDMKLSVLREQSGRFLEENL